MTFFKILLIGLLLLIVGGFTALAFMDVPIKQEQTKQTISINDLNSQ